MVTSPPPDTGLGVVVWSGVGVAAFSVAAATALVVAAAVAEAAVTDPSLAWDSKSTLLNGGRGALIALVVPAVGLLAGTGLVVWGLVE